MLVQNFSRRELGYWPRTTTVHSTCNRRNEKIIKKWWNKNKL